MKLAFLFAALISLGVNAQPSTCKSRCEEGFGKGDTRCDFICKDFVDRPRRSGKTKPSADDAAAEAAFAAGARQAAASAASASSAPASGAAR